MNYSRARKVTEEVACDGHGLWNVSDLVALLEADESKQIE
jgi:hypothetical protein